MDSNAKSTRWYSGTTDDRGVKIEDFISRLGLHVLNEKQRHPTFQSSRGTSNIDITLATGCANVVLQGWTVLQNVTHSDHNLIVFEVCKKGDLPAGPAPLPKRLRITKEGCVRLRVSLMESIRKLDISTDSREQVEQTAERLTSLVKRTCENCFRVIQPRRKVAPWWTSRLAELKRESYRARRALQRATSAAAKEVLLGRYKEARLAFSHVVITEKKRSWRQFVDSEANNLERGE